MSKGKSGFLAGTLVHTKEGLNPIEDICIGDWVLSNFEDDTLGRKPAHPSEQKYRQVINVFKSEAQAIFDVTYVQPGGEKIAFPLRLTPEHLVMEKRRGWIPADQLKIGSALLLGYFGNVMVTKTRRTEEVAETYDLAVNELGTYFVEKLGVWVYGQKAG